MSKFGIDPWIGPTLSDVLEAEQNLYVKFAFDWWHIHKPVFFVDYYTGAPLIYSWDGGIVYKTYCVFPHGSYYK